MLTYTVQSLPAHGRLFDSTNTLIASAPATIVGDTVTYQPSFNYIGFDSFTYSLDDGGVPPEGGPSNVGTVNITVGGPTVVYSEPFNTDPGWTTTGQWAFGQPLGQSGDPASGRTGQFVYGYNLAGDYTNNMPAYPLTSTPFDCSDLTGVEVSFWRWLGVERSVYDKALFQVSNDGSTWTTLYENSSAVATDEAAWSKHTYDISAIADGQPTVYLRWVMGTTDISVVYHGWNIDDVELAALVPLPSCEGDATGDGVVNFLDLNTVLSNFGVSGIGIPGDLDGDGVVNFIDLNTVLSNFGQNCTN
jgi:hypothetical protein